MLVGRFGDTSGRPYIEGRLLLPRLGVAGNISFLLDTGADVSVLMPLDGGKMQLDYTQLSNAVDTIGAGGLCKDYTEPAMIVFSEAGVALHAYSINLHISSPTPDIMKIPSLLGRDVLDQWKITYDKPHRLLTAEVVTSSVTIPLGLPPASNP